jgi:superfamily II DNA/RNA helicase
LNHKLSVALLIGGVSFGDQDMKIARGADVLIATPGRLLDHVERGKLLLTGVELLVIDEADRMLDMGFIPDIERIVKLVPFTRQTLFFSATMPPEITRLADAFLHNPVRVEVARPASAASTIIQRLVATGAADHEKRERLRELIRNATELQNAIVFCNRKRDVATLHRSLVRHGFNAAALHGDMDQRARMAALEGFRTGETTILVASDVAARGLDIPAVSHVLNYDTPHHAEDYVHRIGRTGRAGRSGQAFTLVAPGDEKSLAAIESLIEGPITWEGATVSELGLEAPPRRGREPRDAARAPRGRSSGRPERGRGRERGPDRERAPERERTPERERPPVRERPPERERDVETALPEPRARSASSARAAEPRAARPARAPAGRGNSEDAPVLGLGDHVPAFLLRPTRGKSSQAE